MFVLLNGLRKLRRSVPQAQNRVRGSLALRHVDAGSCNGCEHELTAASNPFYDLQQYGLNVVASPRHADLLVVTGAVTTRMADALMVAYTAMPDPRFVAALGNCALDVGVLGSAADLAGPLDAMVPVDLRIPGCPPSPSVIIEALTAFLSAPTRTAPATAPPA